MTSREGPLTIVEDWVVSEGELDGRPIVTRFNRGAASLAGSPDFGIQIGIAVPHRKPTDDGLPDEEEMVDLDAIETEIDRLIGARAILVGVITTNDMREFVLYTSSPDWIEQFDTDLQAAIDHHSPQVMAQSDPEWSVFGKFVR